MSHSFTTINQAIKSKSIEEYCQIIGSEHTETIQSNLSELDKIDKQIKQLELQYLYDCLQLQRQTEEEMSKMFLMRKCIVEGTSFEKFQIEKEGIPNFYFNIFEELALIGQLKVTKDEEEIIKSIIDIEKNVIELTLNKEKLTIFEKVRFTFIFKENKIIKNKRFTFELQHERDCMDSIVRNSGKYVPIDTFELKEEYIKKSPKNESKEISCFIDEMMHKEIDFENNAIHSILLDTLYQIQFTAINLYFGIDNSGFNDFFDDSDDDERNENDDYSKKHYDEMKENDDYDESDSDDI